MHICNFIAILRFVKIYTFFGYLLARSASFGQKTVFPGQEVNYYMVHIAYYTELNVQICNYEQKRRIYHTNSKFEFDENLYDHFCPRRKAANFCHPVQCLNLNHHGHIIRVSISWSGRDRAI